MRFQTSPLLKPFSKASVFIGIFERFSVHDRQKRIKKYTFSNENASVWMGPEINANWGQIYLLIKEINAKKGVIFLNWRKWTCLINTRCQIYRRSYFSEAEKILSNSRRLWNTNDSRSLEILRRSRFQWRMVMLTTHYQGSLSNDDGDGNDNAAKQ